MMVSMIFPVNPPRVFTDSESSCAFARSGQILLQSLRCTLLLFQLICYVSVAKRCETALTF